MPTFIGLAFALVLLYLWLLGHWFARVVMVLALAVLFGGVAVSLRSSSAAWPPPWRALFAGVGNPWTGTGKDLLSMELFHY